MFREILRKIKQAIIRFLSFGLMEDPNPTQEAIRSLDQQKGRLEELRVLAAKVSAAEYNIERDLAVEREWLERLEQGDGVGDIERSRERVNELESQLAAARACSEQAKEQAARFQEELRVAYGRVRDAQMQGRLADLMNQAENIAFDTAVKEDFAAIERIEHSAQQAQARADAAAELNAALGIGENDPPESSPEGRTGV